MNYFIECYNTETGVQWLGSRKFFSFSLLYNWQPRRELFGNANALYLRETLLLFDNFTYRIVTL